jgi:uncharacterized protein (UPF0335 family)
MTDTAGIPGDRIRSFIERVEHIEDEIKALSEGKKEVFTEAKGEGFDVKVLREILRLRKQDKDERDEQESLLDLYLRAMESAGSSQAKAAQRQAATNFWLFSLRHVGLRTIGASRPSSPAVPAGTG